MGKKKLQGADGMNFQLQLTIKGLESINLPEENLTNESGNDIMKISCWGGKLSAYVNLPNAIRPNNVQPFQLSDNKDRFNACKYIIDKAYGANTAFLLDGTEDTAPTVIRIVPYGKENEDDEDWAWEQEWNNAPDENEDE